jgi:tRNA(fMet)-specific endonuclease VapC
VLERFRAVEAGDAVISAITHGELIYGAERHERRAQFLTAIEEFIGLVPVVPVPSEAGAEYGQLRSALERKGQIIGNNDLWIAAHAIAADLILVTNNTREFRRVPGLKIENWAE